MGFFRERGKEVMDTPSVVSDKESMVDPFLLEVLQNPRHRLTGKLSVPPLLWLL